MRGKVAKGLRQQARSQVASLATVQARKVEKGEVDKLYNHKKREYMKRTVEPKLKTSAHQKRHPGKLYGSSERYRNRPLNGNGHMTITYPKIRTVVPKKPKKRMFNKPKNKVIIEYQHLTNPPMRERFSGVKTEAAARKLFGRRNINKIKSATWWNEKRVPLNLLILPKDIVTE